MRQEARSCGPGPIGPDDVGELRYTMQVLHEALRLCPPGAMISRYAVEDFPALWEDALTFIRS